MNNYFCLGAICNYVGDNWQKGHEQNIFVLGVCSLYEREQITPRTEAT